MKKLIMASSLLAILATSSAYAKTEGDYLGVSLNQSRSDHEYGSSFSDTSVGYGIDFKHAFNFGNNVFVAPGIFYDRIGTSENNVEINDRFGVKLDVGYDINHQFAAYFTNGLAAVHSEVSAHTDTTDLKYFYGVGVLFHATRNVTGSIEYNVQRFDANGPISSLDAKTKLEVLKVGIAYHF